MDLITYALCKNLGASAASDAASSASAAQAAQDAAETARAGAESAQSAAVTAQGLAEDAQDAAETARNAAQSAQSAAESAKSGAEAAKSGAETAKTAAETAAGNASDHAEAAASSASAAAQSAQAAQEAAQTALEIIDDEAVAADSTWSSDKISAEIETISPDDNSVGAKPWSSKQIIDALCPPLEETGNPVQCYPVAGYPLGVKASWEPRQEGEGDPSPENIRSITGLDEVTVTLSDGMSDGTTATLSLPSTVYGGEVDVATGEGVETWAYLVFDGTEAWYSTGSPQAAASSFEINTNETFPGISEGGNRRCSHYATKNFSYWNELKVNMFATNSTVVRIRAEFQNENDFKSYLAAQAAAGTPVTIAYKLATPQPIQATGFQTLPAISGQNVLITDADSLTVTGRADPNHIIQTLSDRVAALESETIEGGTNA